MVAYTRDEIMSVSDVVRRFSSILTQLNNQSSNRVVIAKNNKLEAVMLDIGEYELLQKAYDLLEQKEIEEILANRTTEEKEIAHSKVIKLD